MKTLYLCQYSTNNYDDWMEFNCFVTDDKEKAIKWVDKFNALAEKGKDHYIDMSNKIDYFEGFFNWREFNKAYYSEVSFR